MFVTKNYFIHLTLWPVTSCLHEYAELQHSALMIVYHEHICLIDCAVAIRLEWVGEHASASLAGETTMHSVFGEFALDIAFYSNIWNVVQPLTLVVVGAKLLANGIHLNPSFLALLLLCLAQLYEPQSCSCVHKLVDVLFRVLFQ
jgi:hypothetical protein